jgi:hypothetical protein
LAEPANTPDSAGDAAKSGDAGAAKRPSGRRWIVAGVLGALVVVCLVPIVMTATPRQCASCHEMKPYYESWQTSSHREAVPNCLTCHVTPGIFNLIGFELSFYRMLSAHFAGTAVQTTVANAPNVASCVRSGCHSLNREVSNSGDLKINHRLHVTTEHIACPTCHPGAVHSGVGGRLKLPPMKLCKKCHADKMTECTFCHTAQHLQAAPGVHDTTSTP